MSTGKNAGCAATSSLSRPCRGRCPGHPAGLTPHVFDTRATGVALARVPAQSRQRVVVLLNRPAVDLKLRFFKPHVHVGQRVFVERLRGQTVLFFRDMQRQFRPTICLDDCAAGNHAERDVVTTPIPTKRNIPMNVPGRNQKGDER